MVRTPVAVGTGALLALWRDAQARGWRALDIETGWRFTSADGLSTMGYRFGDGVVVDLVTAVDRGRTLTVTGVIGQAEAVALLRHFLGWREATGTTGRCPPGRHTGR